MYIFTPSSSEAEPSQEPAVYPMTSLEELNCIVYKDISKDEKHKFT